MRRVHFLLAQRHAKGKKSRNVFFYVKTIETYNLPKQARENERNANRMDAKKP